MMGLVRNDGIKNKPLPQNINNSTLNLIAWNFRIFISYGYKLVT